MASEYLKWKYRDVKPRETRELTPAEKRKNWWHYHKWHVVIGAVLAGIGVSLVCNALGVGQTRPDYQVAYVGETVLPDDTAAAIENAFASLGEDLNGDGKVTVLLNQYPRDIEDPQAAMAIQVRLMADLSSYDSCFFLLDDPERFQQEYRSLSLLDGSLPEEGDYSAQGKYLPWDRCPVLAGLDLGEYSYNLLGTEVTGDSNELAAGLCLARRGVWTEKNTRYPEGCQALWAALTEGALE